MSGKHCRLYDENLVHNIMVSTGLSVIEFLRENRHANTNEICEFVEVNAPHIIEDTIDHLNSIEGTNDQEPAEGGREPWSLEDEEP